MPPKSLTNSDTDPVAHFTASSTKFTTAKAYNEGNREISNHQALGEPVNKDGAGRRKYLAGYWAKESALFEHGMTASALREL
ncbi:uncharacterized protein RAG0_05990 [Rhynchosporium agropyri]|uniref:Uncharacterized protein n=1 Tax=Rhynchosporium agropyri TaxID=914238 RepID=A0A1E1KFN5_9HELO|nr:uncharacterized protein RAG0_05990 [Rhynchosporium agropyri]